ncbi:MAG: thiamine pyrophosphate-dependent enzyme [Spirochaetes bacterium]|nr:thiamine pyrophosphate-dependent enzyme [Spirochaetota bacterium]
MKLRALASASRLMSLTVTGGDWARQEPATLRWMAQLLLLIRRFEETVLELAAAGHVHGPVHSAVGQEAVAVGAALALRPGDRIMGTHRSHHHYLAKVLTALAPAAYDPLGTGLTPEMHEAVRVLLAEVMGLAAGCSGGRGGSMHLSHPAAGVIATDAIAGGGTPIATGVAWADLRLGREAATLCFIGDGAVYQGILHESANLAALWKVPVAFVIENNQYAVATPVRETCAAGRLSDVAAAYGLSAVRVDGMDPLAVMLAVRELLRGGDPPLLPGFIEAETYRYYHHSGTLAGSAFGYRTVDEENEWRARDPISRCGEQLWRTGLLDEAGGAELRGYADRCVAAAVDACTERRATGLVVPDRLWPDPRTLAVGLRHDCVGAGPAGATVRDGAVEAADLACTQEIRYVEAIAGVTGRWLERDARVVVLGEEVANADGGACGATRNLAAAFPGRVINTPVSEAGFTGLACGAALAGLHPVVEIMFPSFALVAADQLFNQAGQLGWIHGGIPVPLVARTRVAAGLGYGARHGLHPAALFSLFPGWRVVAPSTPFDYIGLFNTAMSCGSPTLVVEHQALYPRKGMVPDGPPDHFVAWGKARVVRPGRHVTVVAYSAAVMDALEAARLLAADGIEAEVIDLRSLDAAGTDYATIGASLERTGCLAVVEHAPSCASLGPRIAAECQRRFFDALDGPVALVAGPDVPLPASKRLEAACIPTVADIAAAAARAARRKG